MTIKLKFLAQLIVLVAGLALIVPASSWKPLLDTARLRGSESVTLPRTSSDPPATPFSLGGSGFESHTLANTSALVLEQQFSPIATQTPTSTWSSAPTRTPAPTQEQEALAGTPINLQLAAYSISGRVVDINDRPIPGVRLMTGTTYSATTDASGNFSLTQLAPATYTLTPSKPPFSFSPIARSVRVPANVAGQDFVIAPDIGFRPERDGYSFNNPGQAKADCSDLQRAFTRLPIQCSQGQPQQEYLDLFDRFQFAFGTGTCTGMAVTSLGYYARLITAPQAAPTWDMKPGQAWPNIAMFHGRQYGKGVLDRRADELARWNTNNSAVISQRVDEVYRQLRLAVQPGNPDPVVIDLVPRGGCNIPTPGHTDTPYRLDESDPLRPKVYLYENYAAGDSNRFIQFDFSGPVHRFSYWKWDSAACSALLVVPLSAFTGPDGAIPSGHVPHVK